MTTKALLLFCLLSAPALAQGNVTNAKLETRAATQPLGREVAAVASRGQASWIGYRVPMVDGSRRIGCSDGDWNERRSALPPRRRGGVTMTRDETPANHARDDRAAGRSADLRARRGRAA